MARRRTAGTRHICKYFKCRHAPTLCDPLKRVVRLPIHPFCTTLEDRFWVQLSGAASRVTRSVIETEQEQCKLKVDRSQFERILDGVMSQAVALYEGWPVGVG